MFDRTKTASRMKYGYSTSLIALTALFVTLSMFFASATDVRAMLRPDEATARASAAPHRPVVIPEEWIWRGPKPVSIESMYGNRTAANEWNATGRH